MRSLFAAILACTVAAGCASLQYAGDPDGRVITIHNESSILLDLSYRCAEIGPVRRLGTIPPRSVDTFPLQPADCGTVHLVNQPLGLRRADASPFAVIPLFDQQSVELVLNERGLVMRR